MNFKYFLCCCPVVDSKDKKSKKKCRKKKEGRKAQSVSADQLALNNSCYEKPAITIGCAEEPTVTTYCATETSVAIDCAKEPLTLACAAQPSATIDGTEKRAPAVDCVEEPGLTISCAEETSHTINHTEEPADTIHCDEGPAVNTYCEEEPAVNIHCEEGPAVNTYCEEEPAVNIHCEEGPAVNTYCEEEPAVNIHCEEGPAVNIHCKGGPAVNTHCEEEPAVNIHCGVPALPTECVKEPSPTIDCTEGPVTTIDCTEGPVTTIDCASAVAINCTEQPAVTIDRTEQQRLEFQRSRKFQELPLSTVQKSPPAPLTAQWSLLARLTARKSKFPPSTAQNASERSTTDHAVLGFPNIGNTCFMNATLQSLFSLQIFSQNIRREESCWRSNPPTHLLKALVDLHSARASSSSRQKISLLKTLKQTIATNYSDFCGDEQQDAHEFLSVLLSQLKDEGASLRTSVELHPYQCSIETHFEFELLSTRTCLSCGETVCRTELYNCLSVDLVPGGSVKDSVALYFKGCEVEFKCWWCSGQMSSVEQRFQSLPRVLVVQLKRFSFSSRGKLVKLHDRLYISPQLSLQAYSRASARIA